MLKKRMHSQRKLDKQGGPADIIHLDDDENEHEHSEEEIQDIRTFLELEERKKRRNRGQVLPREVERIAEEQAIKLNSEMQKAYRADIAANIHQKESTEKVKMLPMVEQNLRSRVVSIKFLENKGEKVLSYWLSKLPDKSEMHVSFRIKLLKVLFDMKVPSFETIPALYETVKQLYQKEKNNTLRNLECDLLTKWDKLRDMEESEMPFDDKEKEKSFNEYPEVYKERDIRVILKNKRNRKTKKLPIDFEERVYKP